VQTIKPNARFMERKLQASSLAHQNRYLDVVGCGKGGDAIEFVKEYENLGYYEALEKIASIINFQLKYEIDNNRKDDILRYLTLVQDWYRKKSIR